MVSNSVVILLYGFFTAEARENVLAAMKEIQNVSCVRFKDKDDGDKHWIKIVKKGG